jgi:CelD/BcsL family acetyltransferase involved in cellulose biosynthesis
LEPRWDTFVKAHPDGLVYHHSAWLQTLEREYASDPLALLCETRDGRVCGILPLMRTRGLPLLSKAGEQVVGPRLSSLPRTPLAGPLSVTRQADAALVVAAIDAVRAEPELRLQLKTEDSGLQDLAVGIGGLPWRVTYVLPLPNRQDELRFGNSRNHSRLKWAVNKATRLNVEVRPAGSVRDLRVWYELYLETMRWHALPARPYRLFTAMWELLQPHGLMTLLLAEQRVGGRSRVLAGSLFLKLGGTMVYAFNGRRREGLALRPNDLLLWRAIHDAWAEGFRRVDFGEVVEGEEGLAKFKSKWGTTPVRLYRYYYPPLAGVSDEHASGSRLAALAKAAWRRLPLRATELLGDRIYRYL